MKHVERIKKEEKDNLDSYYLQKGEPSNSEVMDVNYEEPSEKNKDQGKIVGKVDNVKSKDEMWQFTDILEKGKSSDLSDIAVFCADKELPLKPEKVKNVNKKPSAKDMFKYFVGGSLLRLSLEDDRIKFAFSTNDSRTFAIFVNCFKDRKGSRSFCIINKETYYLTDSDISYFRKKFKDIYKKWVIDKIDNPDNPKSFGYIVDGFNKSYFEKFLDFVFSYFFNQEPQETTKTIEFI
jgi:hypothetical protein